MKIKTQYEFEPGDMVVNTKFLWVAIRLDGKMEGIGEWAHSNSRSHYPNKFLTDKQVQKYLDSVDEPWEYLGNHAEKFSSSVLHHD